MRAGNIAKVMERRASLAAGAPKQNLFTKAAALPFASGLERTTSPSQQPVNSMPSPPKMKFEVVPSKELLEKGLKEIESSHPLFELLDRIKQKAVAGTLTAAEFQGLRDTLLAIAHLEENHELVALLNFVGEKAFKLPAKNTGEAFYQHLAAGTAIGAKNGMSGYVKTAGDLLANKDRRPHLELAKDMVDGPLTSTLRQVFISCKDKMSQQDFESHVDPWLLQHPSDPAYSAPAKVQGPAEAQTIQYSVQTFVDAFGDVLVDSPALAALARYDSAAGGTSKTWSSPALVSSHTG